ncbi:hypothetical protein BCR44DRAFT_38834 [Catenaria anguillulae PL171]|uniref:Ankyrin repeat-containing domain protein n=1 Tax=Catenaria anguillulae PL171 TaxID=765915 RepID=A0A1Y2HFD5_9FUNG|nr:hypothetical protein BCR44DRAFT_38834 [Catenaria anguillulae PL171]
MHRPDVDLMWAARDDNLKLLKFTVDWSKEPEGRPLHYCSWQTVQNALELDSPRVLEWLFNQPGLYLTEVSGYQLAGAMCGKGRANWHKWWQSSASQRFKDRGSFENSAMAASQDGRLDILDWLLANLGATGIAGIAFHDYDSAIVAAARQGHVDVMDWWLGKVQSGAIPVTIDWVKVVKAGFDYNNVAVLEWCKRQPQAAEALQKARETQVVACEMGDLELVKELHATGHLTGSRRNLIQSALKSGNVQLLDWIQATIDPSVAGSDVSWDWMGPYERACQLGKVDLLDWLVANGYDIPQPGQKRAYVFYCAVSENNGAALDWLFENGFAHGMSLRDWSGCLESASSNGYIDMLRKLAEIISMVCAPTLPASRPQRGRPIPARILHDAFSNGHVDVIEWWLKESGSLLKASFDLDHGKPYLEACTQYARNPSRSLAALKTWYQGGRPIDYAECIHEASIRGRVDVLDWLLHSTIASKDDFVKAWSDAATFPDETYAETMYAHYWFDVDNHSDSLVWWRDNLPKVAALPVNRGPYENPIHAHYLKHMVGNASFELLEPFHAIEEYDGLVDLLEYWKQTGRVHELEEDADRCLTAATEYGNCLALDWWKASGLKMECPEEVLTGERPVLSEGREWWAKSGLVDQSQIVNIKVR